jgi:hypothetical protein
MRALLWVKFSLLGSIIVNPLVCVFVFLSVICAQSSQVVFKVDSVQSMFLSSWKCKTGDSVAWSMPTYDDSHWPSIGVDGLPLDERGIFWLRTTIRVEGSSENGILILVISRLQSAYEVYWDGMWIGANGSVGVDDEREIPGKLHYAVPLPSTGENAGVHVSSLRCSNVHASAPARTCSLHVREAIFRS